MKKTLLALTAMALSVTAFSQTISDNLIAHYEFTNGSVVDLSGNNNNAVNVGASVTTGVSNSTNEALSLASGNHIVLPSSLFLKNSLSISVWFKTSFSGGILGYQNRAVSGTPNQYVPIAYLGSDRKLKAGFWSGTQRNINGRNIIYADNNWHHLVITVRPGKQTLYIDGTQAGTANVGHTILSGMTFNQIGRAYTKGWSQGNISGWSTFFGSIDKVRVYDAEISSAVVNDIYNLEVTGGTFITPDLTPDLIADYQFYNGSMADSSSYQRDAVNSGSVSATDRFGNMNYAVELDGTSHIALPSAIMLGTTRSVSLWFKTSSAGAILGYQNSVVGTRPSQYVPLVFIKTNNELSSSFWSNNVDENVHSNLTNYADDNWHHLVMTTTDLEQKVYVDNVLTGTLNEGHAVLSAMIRSQLGTAYTDSWTGTNGDWFNFTGSLDDVQIYKNELSVSQVDSLFNLPNPMTITGFSDNIEVNKLSIYPNPASSFIYTQEGKLEILDSWGNTVLSTTSEGKVDVSSLATGLYSVLQDRKTTKLIIE